MIFPMAIGSVCSTQVKKHEVREPYMPREAARSAVAAGDRKQP